MAPNRGGRTPVEREMQEAVDLVGRAVGGRRVSLLLPLDERKELRIAAAVGLPARVVGTARTYLGKGIAGHVAQTRHPLLVNEPRPDVRHRGTAAYTSASFISVPVMLDPERCGVLNIADPTLHAGYSEEHLATMQLFARLIARGLNPWRADLLSRRARDERSRLHQQLIEAQELERARLARDLHDEAGHSLATAIFRLDIEARKLPPESDATLALGRARDALMTCADALHHIAFTLQPRILADLGLIPALRSLIAQVEELGQLHVSLSIDGTPGQMSPEAGLTIFRIVQEALTNVRKHAGTDQACVALHFRPSSVALTVEDVGVGIDLGALRDRLYPALGLRGMRERVELLGGTHVVSARRGGGTVVAATLPLVAR